MIELSETNLSPTDYNLLNGVVTNPAFQLILHRANLIFTTYADLPDEDTKVFDASIVTGNVLVVYAGTLYQIDDEGDVTSTPVPASSWYALRGNKLYTLSGNTINVQTINVGTLSAGSPSSVGTAVDTGHMMASVADGRVYYFSFNSTTRLYRLCWLGSEGTGSSDIFWQYPIQSMDAVRIPGTEKDVIVFATQAPGTVAVKADGTELYKTMEFAGGIFAVTCEDDIVSDPFELDVFDHLGGTRFRRDVRLTYAHGQLLAVAYSSTGRSKSNPVRGYRVYVSRTGTYWSLGSLLPISQSLATRGGKVILAGDKFYFAQPGRVWESDCTITYGHSAPSTQIDLTNEVVEYQITQDKMFQAEVVLGNVDNSLMNNALFSGDNTFTLSHYWGTWVNSVKKLVLLGTTDVDYYTFKGSYDSTLTISGRDWMHRLTDYSQSEEAKYGEGQLQGGDRYEDNTNTRYGGMRHTSPQRGMWQTVDNQLQLWSNNEEGVAFNTYSPYLWNGFYRTEFSIGKVGNAEFAGIVFRASDYQNMWYVLYRENTDVITVVRRIAGNDTVMAQTSAMSWAGSTATRHIAVWFYLGRLRLYTSSNGITWVQSLEYMMPGEHPPNSKASAILDRGFVGVIGRGYAPEFKWEWPEFNWPAFYYQPIDLDFDIDLGLDLDEYNNQKQNPADVNHAMVWNEGGQLLITNNFSAQKPTWRVTLEEDVQDACFDSYMGSEGWAIQNTGANLILKHNPDVVEDTWDTVHTLTSVNAYTSSVDLWEEGDWAFGYMNGTHTRVYWKKHDEIDITEITVNSSSEGAGRPIKVKFMRNGNLLVMVYAIVAAGTGAEKVYQVYMLKRSDNSAVKIMQASPNWGGTSSVNPLYMQPTWANDIIIYSQYTTGYYNATLGTSQAKQYTLPLPTSTDYNDTDVKASRRVLYFQNNRYSNPQDAFAVLGTPEAPTIKIDTRTDVSYTYKIGFQWELDRPMPVLSDVFNGSHLSWTASRYDNAKIGVFYGTILQKTTVRLVDGTEYISTRYWDHTTWEMLIQMHGTPDLWVMTNFGGGQTIVTETPPNDSLVESYKLEVEISQARTHRLAVGYFTIGSPSMRLKLGWQGWRYFLNDENAWEDELVTPRYWDANTQLFVPYGQAKDISGGLALTAALADPSFLSGSRMNVEALGSGQNWTFYDPGRTYTGIHVATGLDSVINYGPQRIDRQPLAVSKNGNIEEIWGSSWTPIGMDTSTGNETINVPDIYDPL